MLSRVLVAEFKWILLVFILSFVLVSIINITTPLTDGNVEIQKTFFGLNLFLEILVFSAFSAFVVFGIKGFFESYSHKFANVIILSTGIVLALVIFILAYQILF